MKRPAEGNYICPEGAKRTKLNPQDEFASPRTATKVDELQSEISADIEKNERNDLALMEVASEKVSSVEVTAQTPLSSLTDSADITFPGPFTPVQKLDISSITGIQELRAMLEKYPELLRLMPKHTRVGKQYQAQIPPCTKSSAFKEQLVVGLNCDLETNFEAGMRERKAMREEMLLKKAQVKKQEKEEETSSPPQYAMTLTHMLGNSDLEEDDSDEDFDYEDAKESNTEKACRAEGIIARRLDCLPGESRDQGKVQYLIRWEDGTTNWEYEELLGDEFGDLIDDYLYREGLLVCEDSRETSADCPRKLSPNFLPNPVNNAILSHGENLESNVEPVSAPTSMASVALQPPQTTSLEEEEGSGPITTVLQSALSTQTSMASVAPQPPRTTFLQEEERSGPITTVLPSALSAQTSMASVAPQPPQSTSLEEGGSEPITKILPSALSTGKDEELEASNVTTNELPT